MKNFYQLSLDQNWRFFERDDLFYFFNLATSRQIKVKFKEKIEREALIFILNNLHSKVAQKNFLNKFPLLDKKWFDNTINKLTDLRVISCPEKKPSFLTNKYLSGLDRQLLSLNALFPEEGAFLKQKQLKDARVACLGLGAIGQYVLIPLLASGISNFVCVDFDKVEMRNIGRQPIFRKEDIGKSKSEVVYNYIKQGRSGVKVRAVNTMITSSRDAERLIRGCDIVIQACDYPRFEVRRWINDACLKLKIASIVVYSGRVGPLCVPYKTSCYGCLETVMKEVAPFYDDFTEMIKKEGLRRYSELAVVPALCGVIAARDIVSFVLGMKPETLNAFFDIHPSTLEIIKHSLLRQKNCYACRKR